MKWHDCHGRQGGSWPEKLDYVCEQRTTKAPTATPTKAASTTPAPPLNVIDHLIKYPDSRYTIKKTSTLSVTARNVCAKPEKYPFDLIVALTYDPLADVKVPLAEGIGSLLTNNPLVGLNSNLDKDLQIVGKVSVGR